ncbi:MAG: hypothetical protein H0T62_08670 [Parachlamydiaceae bacterium]|nr:hypothetical protein [Parachlamydiaceae bacterium]
MIKHIFEKTSVITPKQTHYKEISGNDISDQRRNLSKLFQKMLLQIESNVLGKTEPKQIKIKLQKDALK